MQPLPDNIDFEKTYRLKGSTLAELLRSHNAVANFDIGPGLGGSVSEDGISIYLAAAAAGGSDAFSPFPAKIIGIEDMSGGNPEFMWRYQIEEVNISIGASQLGVPQSVSILELNTPRIGYALNVRELGNTAQYVGDVDVTASDYTSTGFKPMPIGAGGTTTARKTNAIVWIMGSWPAYDGHTIYLFSSMNSHDGACS